MAETKVIMPQLGESIFEGTITKWLKKKGEKVQRDEPLFEISTDKIDSEIPAPASGVVQDILVEEGKTVQINTVVAVIGDESAEPSQKAGQEQPAPSAKAPADAKAPAEPKPATAPRPQSGPAPVAGPVPAASSEPAPAAGSEPAPAPVAEPEQAASDEEDEEGGESGHDLGRTSPLVRRIAKEHGVDLAALAGKGTGLNGRITKRDILAFIEK